MCNGPSLNLRSPPHLLWVRSGLAVMCYDTLKSIFSGPSSVQGVPLYSPRSPTISEQSFDDM